MKMNAHVLAVDPGAAMGAAILGPDGEPIEHHQLAVKDAHKRTLIVTRVVHLALSDNTDIVVVREKWQAGGRRANPKMMAGLGAAWGLWVEQLKLYAPWLPSSRFHQVYPSMWRKHVLGAGAKDSAGWHTLAQNYVASRFKIEDAGPDATVALCIGAYAFMNPKIVASVQSKPQWHGAAKRAFLAKTPGELEAQVMLLQAQVLHLEKELAREALAKHHINDEVDP